MKIKLAAVLMVLVMVFSAVSMAAGANSELDDLNAYLSDLAKKEEENAKKLKDNTIQLQKNEDRLEIVTSQIDNTEKQLDTLGSIISEIEKQKKQKEKELAASQKEYDDYYDVFCQRARANYEADQTTYLDVLLNSKNFSDFLTRYDMVAQIMEYDNLLLDNMKNKCDEITALMNQINQKKAENEAARAKSSKQKSNLVSQKKDKEKTIEAIQNDTARLKKIQADIDKEQRDTEKKITALTDKNKKYVGGDLLWPTPGFYYISSYFGYRNHPITGIWKMHYGIDIAGGGINGTKVLASNDGIIIFAGFTTYEGNVISIDHGGGRTTQYKHLRKMYYGVGKSVKQADAIGEVGSTGLYTTGPHLHYEVSENGSCKNPLNYFK